ncbi:hypothetical protein ACS0TY_025334 [Phlomoides rotata]
MCLSPAGGSSSPFIVNKNQTNKRVSNLVSIYANQTLSFRYLFSWFWSGNRTIKAHHRGIYDEFNMGGIELICCRINCCRKVVVWLGFSSSFFGGLTSLAKVLYAYNAYGSKKERSINVAIEGITRSHHYACIHRMDPVAARVGEYVEQVKPSRGRRSWTRVEEDALINCITDIVNDGWKAENGFKAGFQRELEKGMRKRLPGTDIVANPHINSKIHVWKKEYSAFSDILSKSGIGWNSTTSMIEVEDEGVWDASKRVFYK